MSDHTYMHTYTQVQHELESCQSVVALLQKQLASENLSVQSLESLLVSAREKELQRQLTSQERQAEVQILRDKLCMADSKVWVYRLDWKTHAYCILRFEYSKANHECSCFDRTLLIAVSRNSQSREMAHLRTRSAQLQEDLDITRRHLSTERFER